MICLGIESTAHTFGVGIVDATGKILANAKAVFTTEKGGMIPNKVAEHHKENKEKVLNDALEKAKISLKEVDVISYSHGPGLSPSLLVGLSFAKKLAQENKKPLVGVNHSAAHLTIGDLLCKTADPVYLYVSGVNTQLIARVKNHYKIFGETLDIGLGNALDKFGREIGLGFPAGPKIEQLAKQGQYAELPYAIKGMDVSFSGMITQALRLANKIKADDLCYSLQETCFAMLTEAAERALAHTEKKELLLIGGVAANKRLCEMLELMCKEREVKFSAVPLEFSGDQGAMIAWQGILQRKKPVKTVEADIHPYERVDEVEIVW